MSPMDFFSLHFSGVTNCLGLAVLAALMIKAFWN